MEVTKTTLGSGWIGYRAAGYEVWDAERYEEDEAADKDWAGLYVALEETTARGYLFDKVKDGKGVAYLHKVKANDTLDMIECLDEGFKTGTFDLKGLKAATRGKIGEFREDQPFMSALGAVQFVFKCYHDREGGMEIIVPKALVTKLSMAAYRRIEIRNHSLGVETPLP